MNPPPPYFESLHRLNQKLSLINSSIESCNVAKLPVTGVYVQHMIYKYYFKKIYMLLVENELKNLQFSVD